MSCITDECHNGRMSFRRQSLVSTYRRGYAEAEIVAVCSEYDLDKGHVLFAAVIPCEMQADDLNGKKVKSSVNGSGAFSLNCHLTSDLHGNAFVVVVLSVNPFVSQTRLKLILPHFFSTTIYVVSFTIYCVDPFVWPV